MKIYKAEYCCYWQLFILTENQLPFLFSGTIRTAKKGRDIRNDREQKRNKQKHGKSTKEL